MTLFSCHLNCKALITVIVKHATPPIMDPHAQTHAVLTVETGTHISSPKSNQNKFLFFFKYITTYFASLSV